MIPWIQIYTNLPTHPKVGKLVDALGLRSGDVEPEAVAVGILVGLWTWAAQNTYDGDLTQVSPRTIANACRWKKSPDRLVDALTACGWIDSDMRLHDWEEYASLYIDRVERTREQTRERVRAHRAKKKELFGDKKCVYCGNDATGFDHIVPISRGGTDDDSNLVLCCQRCNSAKGPKELSDFLNTTAIDLDYDSIMADPNLRRMVVYDEFGKFRRITNRKSAGV